MGKEEEKSLMAELASEIRKDLILLTSEKSEIRFREVAHDLYIKKLKFPEGGFLVIVDSELESRQYRVDENGHIIKVKEQDRFENTEWEETPEVDNYYEVFSLIEGRGRSKK